MKLRRVHALLLIGLSASLGAWVGPSLAPSSGDEQHGFAKRTLRVGCATAMGPVSSRLRVYDQTTEDVGAWPTLFDSRAQLGEYHEVPVSVDPTSQNGVILRLESELFAPTFYRTPLGAGGDTVLVQLAFGESIEVQVTPKRSWRGVALELTRDGLPLRIELPLDEDGCARRGQLRRGEYRLTATCEGVESVSAAIHVGASVNRLALDLASGRVDSH